jgi:hypothetical protein
MENNRFVQYTVYSLLVVLSLVAVWLVLNVPASVVNVHPVYQGF